MKLNLLNIRKYFVSLKQRVFNLNKECSVDKTNGLL